jgi:hypothetical protein
MTQSLTLNKFQMLLSADGEEVGFIPFGIDKKSRR